MGNFKFESFRPKVMCKGSKNELGHFSKWTGVTWQRYLTLHRAKVRKKIDFVKFQKFLYRKIELEKLCKTDENQAWAMYNYWVMALESSWKSGGYVIKTDLLEMLHPRFWSKRLCLIFVLESLCLESTDAAHGKIFNFVCEFLNSHLFLCKNPRILRFYQFLINWSFSNSSNDLNQSYC